MINAAHMPLVSIIIPAYNYGMFLGECLESILAQTFVNWECIIVDNGSTDNTKDIVSTFVSKDGRFIYEYTSQRGVSFARNHAVSLSKAKYIFPVDADDKIADTYLEKALKVIEGDAHIKVVYSDAKLFGASSGDWILPNYSFKDLLIENSIFCTALYKKSDFELAGGYNEDMKEGFEDWDFWIRMLKSGGDVYKIPETLFYYRIRSASRNNTLDHIKQLNLRRKIYENHKNVYDLTFKMPDLIFENYLVSRDLKSTKNSTTYKVGSWFLSPLKFIKRKLIK